MDVSKNRDAPPKSSILIRVFMGIPLFSPSILMVLFPLFFGKTPISCYNSVLLSRWWFSKLPRVGYVGFTHSLRAIGCVYVYIYIYIPRHPVRFSDDEQGVDPITETKRIVFRFHETILRRWLDPYRVYCIYIYMGILKYLITWPSKPLILKSYTVASTNLVNLVIRQRTCCKYMSERNIFRFWMASSIF